LRSREAASHDHDPMMLVERRRRRSDQPSVALRYQLEHTRERGRLEAVVLASEDGLPVAAAGDPGICAELAAVAPWLSRSVFSMPQLPLLRGAELACRPIRTCGQSLYLVTAGGSVARDALLSSSVTGLERILSQN
jgi:hypothetical protein